MSPCVVRVHDRVGCRIDRRHPNAGLVHFEQVCDQIVEVDVLLGIVEEGKLAVVASEE
jgi:hypothetical protein